MSRVRIIRENSSAGGGAVYGLGLVGALIYYWQHAHTFLEIILGLFKALVWPAMLIYKVLEYFKM